MIVKKIEQFDLTSQAFKSNPFSELARLREAGPIVRTRLPLIGNVCLATTHEAVNDMLRDHTTFVRDGRSAGKSRLSDLQWWFSWMFRSVSQSMIQKDEPDHRRLRNLVDGAFMRRSVEDMRDRIHELADEILDEMIAKTSAGGEVDFLYFSRQFPLAVICELLGLPDEDRPVFTKWVGHISKVNSFWGLFKVLPGFFKISRYFRRQFRLCRENPRDGLLSLLVQAEHDGDSLNEQELNSMAFLLLFAGHETTTHLISTGLISLLERPDQLAELKSDLSILPIAVEELHRFNSPVQITKPRMPCRDMEYFGTQLKRGEYLIAMLASANQDPDVFDDPEKMILTRSPNPHVGFGMGIHICLGMKLAQLETQIAFERVLTRFPDLQLAIKHEEIQWNPRLGMRAAKSLPVRLNDPS